MKTPFLKKMVEIADTHDNKEDKEAAMVIEVKSHDSWILFVGWIIGVCSVGTVFIAMGIIERIVADYF